MDRVLLSVVLSVVVANASPAKVASGLIGIPADAARALLAAGVVVQADDAIFSTQPFAGSVEILEALP